MRKMSDACSEQDLIQQSCWGDRSAYEELVVRYYRSVYALCLGILANTEEARDLAQETMLAGFQKIGSLRGTDKFQHWILQIARNLCIDTLRKRQALARHQANLCLTQHEELRPAIDIQWAIEKLPEELRIPIVMFYFDGKNPDCIADILQISKSNLYQRMRNARARLCELLQENV